MDKICIEEECDRPGKHARGYCATHYARRSRAGEFWSTKCSTPECERFAVTKGMCPRHYKNSRYRMEVDDVNRQCTFIGCKRIRYNQIFCEYHYQQDRLGIPKILVYKSGDWNDPKPNSKGYMVQTRTIDGVRTSRMVHRSIVEDDIGRPLEQFEEIHHLNGNRADNRIENLEIWSTKQPKGQRPEDKVEYALEILNLYAPDKLK